MAAEAAGIRFAFGKDVASRAAVALAGLNICFGRKKHLLLGLLLSMIPFWGIINGLLTPVICVKRNRRKAPGKPMFSGSPSKCRP